MSINMIFFVWLINNDQAMRPHLLTIYHNDTPCYYWPNCIHNASTMNSCASPPVGAKLTLDTPIQQSP